MEEIISGQMKIAAQGWNGWSPEQPKPQEFNFEVKAGDEIDSSSVGGEVLPEVIKILAVDADKVRIQTNLLVPQHGDEAIDLTIDVDDKITEIKKGQSVKLATQTTDAGTEFTITYL